MAAVLWPDKHPRRDPVLSKVTITVRKGNNGSGGFAEK
jgi:hypothetical protein